MVVGQLNPSILNQSTTSIQDFHHLGSFLLLGLSLSNVPIVLNGDSYQQKKSTKKYVNTSEKILLFEKKLVSGGLISLVRIQQIYLKMGASSGQPTSQILLSLLEVGKGYCGSEAKVVPSLQTSTIKHQQGRDSARVWRYLLEHPEYMDEGVTLSQFSFQIPKPLQEDYVRKRSTKKASHDDTELGEVRPLAWADPRRSVLPLPYLEASVTNPMERPTKQARRTPLEHLHNRNPVPDFFLIRKNPIHDK